MVQLYQEEMQEADPMDVADLEEQRLTKKFEPWVIFAGVLKTTIMNI
jgi:hypothetical protein